MVGRTATRRLLLVLALALLPGLRAAAQDMIRIQNNTPNSDVSISVQADEIVESAEVGATFYRLNGRVLVKQGTVECRAKRGVVRVSPGAGTSRKLDVYLEEDVFFENGTFKPKGSSCGYIDLATRGSLQIVPTARQSLSDDPFVERAKAVFNPAQTIVQAQATVPPPLTNPNVPSPRPVPLIDPGQGLPVFPSVPLERQPTIVSPPEVAVPVRQLRIGSRTGGQFEVVTPGPNTLVLTGGILLSVNNVEKLGIVDMSADSVVIWTKGNSDQFLQKIKSEEGNSTRESEFFLSGNVVVRTTTEGQERVLRADQIYYDIGRNVAIATNANIEFREKGIPDAIIMKSAEAFQIGPNDFVAEQAIVFSSHLPSDPGLKVVLRHVTITDQRIEKRNIFGVPFINQQTGEPEITTERLFRGDSVFFEVADVPVFWLPHVEGKLNDPGGPLRNLGAGNDNIFGVQFFVDLDMFYLLGITPPAEADWTVSLDYMSKRGPAGGTNFKYAGNDLYGIEGRYSGSVKLWGIFDHGTDQLGGGRGPGDDHPLFRDRAFWRHQEDFPGGWQFMGQLSYLPDKNFLEQFYKPEFDGSENQETFVYATNRTGVLSGSILVEPNIRSWVTETAWLPKAEGHVLGWSPLDLLTYNARASVGYASLHTASNPPPVEATDVATNTGRFDFWQELNLPFSLGPMKVVPFGIIDLTGYTNDIAGNPIGRFYAAGGARASIQASRLFPDVQSELFNLQAINHKSVFTATYYAAYSSVPYSQLPQLDRLNNDPTDQSLRDITPLQGIYNPGNAAALQTSPVYNPQLYAIRRLLDSNVDTLDSIQELQLDWRNRWQTKRGFPGMEHTVDAFTLDTSISIFPNPNRDNFGSTVGFIEYDAGWNVGDRTSVFSNGWVDPFTNGARYFALGTNLNRTDRTNFGFAFRYTDPLDSRVVSASVNYVFSPKYSMTAVTNYDFGLNKGLSHSLIFTRNGTDLQVNLSVTYNPILNNFGVNVDVVPLLVAAQRTAAAFANPNAIHGR